MSGYLDQTIRTENEALADARKKQAKIFRKPIDRAIKLCKAMKQKKENDNSQFPLATSRK